jgi:hypothetical protein
MDPFVEKELIDVLRNINFNLRDVKNELCEIKLAIREMGEVVEEVEEDEKGNFKCEDVGEEEDEAEEGVEEKVDEKADEEEIVEINL